MSLPNRLTVARIAAIPFFLLCLLVPVLFQKGGRFGEFFGFAAEDNHPFTSAILRTFALLITIFVTITDWLDGKIARERGLTSNFGKLMDPLADKLFVTSAFVAFVELSIFPSWLIIIILCREFLVSGLRSLAASMGKVMEADRWGKHKTGWQLATIITTIAFLAAKDYLRAAGLWDRPLASRWHAEAIYAGTLHLVLLVAVALTVLSGLRYMQRNWDIVMDSERA